MAKIKVGDRVKFNRSHNKAVSLTGTVKKLHDDGRSVDIDVETEEGKHVETAHVDECQVIEKKAKAAD